MSKRRRAEVERPATNRGGVDQVADHLGDGPHRPAPQPVGPEHPRDVALRSRAAGAGSSPPPRSATKRATGLDLDHAPGPDVPHRGARGSEPTPARRAGRRPPRRRPPRGPAIAGRVPSIGSTTSTHSASPRRRDEAAILRVEGDVRRPLGEEALQERLRPLVDREGDVPSLGRAGVGAAGVAAELRGRSPRAARPPAPAPARAGDSEPTIRAA